MVEQYESVKQGATETETPWVKNAETMIEMMPTLNTSTTPISTEIPSPDAWKNLTIVPEASEEAQRIYALGQSLGRNPHAFSKVGDCGGSNAWFLAAFDKGSQYYELGEYAHFNTLIYYFKGSFSRMSIATRNGFNAASVLSPLWADPNQCKSGETPLACEYRIHNPSYAFIMLGTNDRWHLDAFESNMREILEYTLEQGIIPIIATKADNAEGDESINRVLVQLSLDYGIPLWNFWLAVQPLPNQGLEEDGSHLTWGPPHFDDPEALQMAWPVRNLTAMQALYAVWQAVSEP